MAILPGQGKELPSLRQVVHCAAAAVLHYSGLLSLYSGFRRRVLLRRDVIVIGFHRVLTPEQAALSFSEPSMIMLLPTFEKLVLTLQRWCRVVSISELETLPESDGVVHPNGVPSAPAVGVLGCNTPQLGVSGASTSACLLTFDDGWRDTFENAYPILKQQRMRAVVFVPTGMVGDKRGLWAERLARVWDQVFPACGQELSQLTDRPVATLKDAIAALKTLPRARQEEFITVVESQTDNFAPLNLVDSLADWDAIERSTDTLEIASHTVNHAFLTCESPNDIERELADSKRQLGVRVKAVALAFAYPGGAYSDDVRNAVAKAGYSLAFTAWPGRHGATDDRLAIPRVLLHEGNVTGLTGKFSPAMLHLRLMGWR